MTSSGWSGGSYESGGVYRLYNREANKHLFSANKVEIDILTGQGWANEGMSFRSASTDNANQHRFFVEGNNRHFYTANNREKDLIMKNPNMQHYNYEGIALKFTGSLTHLKGVLPLFDI